jgi:putative ABC transport system permease protein
MVVISLRKNSVAWLQLRDQKAQTAAAILGIAFTTILLFMQIGFRSGFLDTFIDIPRHLRGDLFVVSASTTTVLRPAVFSQRRLYQAFTFDEVQSVTPIYMSGINMRDPTGRPQFLRNVAVIAFPLVSNPFDIAKVDDGFEALKRGRAFLIDERSRPAFMPVVKEVRKIGRKSIEVRAGARQIRVSVEGVFPLGANVTNDANVLSSDRTFFELLNREPNLINIGLIMLKPGADVAVVTRKLNDYLRCGRVRQGNLVG